MQKYTIRFSWYVIRNILLALLIFGGALATFFIAMDSANVYVIATDGMKARAENILQGEENDLTPFFTRKFLDADMGLRNQEYNNFAISDFVYHLSVESLWCQPWSGVANVTLVESIPQIYGALRDTENAGQETSRAAETPIPPWTRARYRLSFNKTEGGWQVSSMELLGVLEPEPTPSPDPAVTPTPEPTPEQAAPTEGNAHGDTP